MADTSLTHTRSGAPASYRPRWWLIVLALFGIMVVTSLIREHQIQQPAAAVPLPPSAAELAAQKKQADAAAKLIRSWGYDCRSVDHIVPDAWTTVFSHESWTVACNGYRYLFTIENHGGRWSVKSS